MPSHVLVLATAVLLLAVSSVRAQETPPAEQQLEVDSLTFVGVEAIDESNLRSVLETRVSPWLPWGRRYYFEPERLEVDLRRIVAYYRDHGYPEARVVSHDVDVDTGRQEVDITITVEEGPPLLVGDVVLEGFDVLRPEQIRELRESLPVSEGAVLVHPQVLTGGELAVTALKNEGYAYAEVRIRREDAGPQRTRVIYAAEPGPIAFFGPIEIVGNASVDDEVVRRQLVYRPGERFRLSQIRESQRQLYALELFEFATIEPVLVETRPTIVATRVTVAESDHRKLLFSAGYGTEEKLRGEVSWRHVNFFGAARVLALNGKWSSLDRGGEVDFVQPYFFHPDLALALNGHTWYADELAYRAVSEGGRVGITGQAGRNSTWRLTYTHEYTRSEISNEALRDLELRDELIALGLDPTTGEQDGVLSALSLSAQYSTTDDLLNPRRGYFAGVFLEQAGSWLPGDFRYVNASLDLRGYLPLSDTIVLAGRLHTAGIEPFDDARDVPFAKRYFLGGSSSLRGWGRFEVAPLSASGLPLGGFSLFESSVELRARVWGNIGLVLFADAGNVWRNGFEYHFDDLLYDVGPGLRYLTPVGPLRVDFAYQLTPLEGLLVDGEPQDRRWRVHFSIGQSF